MNDRTFMFYKFFILYSASTIHALPSRISNQNSNKKYHNSNIPSPYLPILTTSKVTLPRPRPLPYNLPLQPPLTSPSRSLHPQPFLSLPLSPRAPSSPTPAHHAPLTLILNIPHRLLASIAQSPRLHQLNLYRAFESFLFIPQDAAPEVLVLVDGLRSSALRSALVMRDGGQCSVHEEGSGACRCQWQQWRSRWLVWVYIAGVWAFGGGGEGWTWMGE
jgi:hypothetical protein